MGPRRRSVYADRLREHAAFAAGDDAVFARRGRWRDFFRERMGPAFDDRVILEIGCADGEFLATLAARHPATAFVGLDWKYRALFTAAERVGALGLRNVALLRGRGQEVARVFGDGEIDEILVLHPDPCARPEERPNRLFAEPFLVDAHRTLRPGGTLTLKTDHPGYHAAVLGLLGVPEPEHFALARALAERTPGLTGRLEGSPRVRASDLPPAADVPPRSSAVAERFTVAAVSADFWNDPAVLAHTAGRVFAGERTPFERRFLKKRQPIYYVELAKSNSADARARSGTDHFSGPVECG